MGGHTVRITADTNLLVRAIIEDDVRQAAQARSELQKAEAVALALPALCELVWVLVKGYRVAPGLVAEAIRRLAASGNVVVDRPAVDAGLAMMDAGGDFADGVIAHAGMRLGSEVFVSFDRAAVKLLNAGGGRARLPG